jgi:hypothetical protein
VSADAQALLAIMRVGALLFGVAFGACLALLWLEVRKP